jgi:hypothetical protein
MNGMKLCKDCKYCGMDLAAALGHANAICTHPDAPINLVYGHKDGSCNLMRSRNCLIPQCGADGDWFEQAPPVEPFAPGAYTFVPVEAPRAFTLSERFARWIWGAKE